MVRGEIQTGRQAGDILEKSHMRHREQVGGSWDHAWVHVGEGAGLAGLEARSSCGDTESWSDAQVVVA